MGHDKPPKSVPRAERKAKKRKAEEAIPDVPEDYQNEEETPVDEVKSKKRQRTEEEKEAKKAKKSKKEDAATEDMTAEGDVEMTDASKEGDGEGETEGDEAGDAPRKTKKERKADRKAKEAVERLANPPKEGEGLEVAKTTESKEKREKAEGEEKPVPRGQKPVPLDENGNPVKKKNNRNREKKRLAAAALAASGQKAPPRFITFVGNLPYDVTQSQLAKHLASVHPKSIRIMSDKVTKKGKGCAFVEFEGYDHMKTALRTMHHTELDGDTRDPKKGGGRKINVELTAGGGGNTKVRKGKIIEKNEKLAEQRTRKIGEEMKVREERKTGVKPTDEAVYRATKEDKMDIHPSRRARVN